MQQQVSARGATIKLMWARLSNSINQVQTPASDAQSPSSSSRDTTSTRLEKDGEAQRHPFAPPSYRSSSQSQLLGQYRIGERLRDNSPTQTGDSRASSTTATVLRSTLSAGPSASNSSTVSRGGQHAKKFARKFQIAPDFLRKRSVVDDMVLTSPDQLQALIRQGLRKDVRTLQLNSVQPFDDEDLACVRRCFPGLTSLRITEGAQGITNEGISSLRNLKLHSLHLRGARITDDGLSAIAGMPLHTLELPNCKKVTAQAFEHLQGKDIKTLNLAGTGLGRIDAKMVSQLVALPLEKLDVTGAYEHFSNSDYLVLQAMLDQGLVSHGRAGPDGASEYSAASIDHMKSLYAAGRMRHAPSVSWTERELLGMKPETNTNLLTPIYNSYANVASQLAATTGANLAKATAHALLLDEYKTIIPGVAQQFVAHALNVNPTIQTVIDATKNLSQVFGSAESEEIEQIDQTLQGRPLQARAGQ